MLSRPDGKKASVEKIRHTNGEAVKCGKAACTCRANEIQNQVRGFLRQVDATLEIQPAPSEGANERDPGAELMQRSACKDATPSPPLRSLLSAHHLPRLQAASSQPQHASSPLRQLSDAASALNGARPTSASSLDSGADSTTDAVTEFVLSQLGLSNGADSGTDAAAVESSGTGQESGRVSPSAPSTASTSLRSSFEEEAPNGNLKLISAAVEVCTFTALCILGEVVLIPIVQSSLEFAHLCQACCDQLNEASLPCCHFNADAGSSC